MLMANVASIATRVGRKIARTAKLNYSKAASAIRPDRRVSFYLDRPFSICHPFRTEAQFKVENTMAFHRGTRPIRNHRVILNLIYTEKTFSKYYVNAFPLVALGNRARES